MFQKIKTSKLNLWDEVIKSRVFEKHICVEDYTVFSPKETFISIELNLIKINDHSNRPFPSFNLNEVMNLIVENQLTYSNLSAWKYVINLGLFDKRFQQEVQFGLLF